MLTECAHFPGGVLDDGPAAEPYGAPNTIEP